jgi:hypothetical protein
MAEQLKVGGELDAWCTSCRLMKWHTIVALVGNKPAKVECQGCHKQHQFRAQPPGTPSTTTPGEKKPRASKAAATPATPSVSFDELLGGRDSEARTYSPNDKFAVGDIVRHPTFDVGVVTSIPGVQKVEITFREGKKILLHDRGGVVPSKLAPPPRRDEGAPVVGTSDSPRGRR